MNIEFFFLHNIFYTFIKCNNIVFAIILVCNKQLQIISNIKNEKVNNT